MKELLELLIIDFSQFVKKIKPKIEVKFGNTSGRIEYNEHKAIITLPANKDFYTQLFVLLHELAHYYLSKIKIRQNEYIPDLLAAAYMYMHGYDADEIIDILQTLSDSKENIYRVMVVYLLLDWLKRREYGSQPCYADSF